MNGDDSKLIEAEREYQVQPYFEVSWTNVLYQIKDDDNNNKKNYNDTSDGSRKKESQKNGWNYAKEQNMI